MRYREVQSLPAADAAYIAGLVDGEGTVTLSRKHAGDNRQLVVSISNSELSILEFGRARIGAGKITAKRTTKDHHAPAYAYAVWNRQALRVLAQIEPYLKSHKRFRAALVREHYVRLTPRNGKYTEELRAARQRFEADLLALTARSASPAATRRRHRLAPPAE